VGSPLILIFLLIAAVASLLRDLRAEGSLRQSLLDGLYATLDELPTAIVGMAWLIFTLWFATGQLLEYFSWPVVIGAWVSLAGAMILLALIAARKEEASRNPLQGILNEAQEPEREEMAIVL